MRPGEYRQLNPPEISRVKSAMNRFECNSSGSSKKSSSNSSNTKKGGRGGGGGRGTRSNEFDKMWDML